MTPFLEAPKEELLAFFTERAQPVYRLKQLQQAVWGRKIGDWNELTEFPKALRETLGERFSLWTSKVAAVQKSSDGSEKLLIELHDGHRVECVLLRDGEKRTICISTQVGCAMGCVFCASGLDGVVRNLSTGEILEQMLHLQRLLPAAERLSHIVVMGMGEPLANLDKLLPALAIATSPEGLGIGARRITISTVGLPPAMERLAAANVGYRLAVSLHAPNDELRTKLVPVNKSIGIEAILAAADRYFEVTGRRVTFEYALLGGVNDRPEHARSLVKLLQRRCALLNVIPYNPVKGLPFVSPRDEDLAEFRRILEQGGVEVKVRRRRGDRIDAACGQLRRSVMATMVPEVSSVPRQRREILYESEGACLKGFRSRFSRRSRT